MTRITLLTSYVAQSAKSPEKARSGEKPFLIYYNEPSAVFQTMENFPR